MNNIEIPTKVTITKTKKQQTAQIEMVKENMPIKHTKHLRKRVKEGRVALNICVERDLKKDIETLAVFTKTSKTAIAEALMRKGLEDIEPVIEQIRETKIKETLEKSLMKYV